MSQFRSDLYRAIGVALLLVLQFMSGCKEKTYEPLVATLQISSSGTTLPPFGIHVKGTVQQAPWILLITRNGKTWYVSGSIKHSSIDTSLQDVDIIPGTHYVYKSYYLFNLTVVDSSAPFSITAMDSSSSAITWHTYQLGGGPATSGLFDVAIVNDTSIWAVGEIWDFDSNGTYSMYNSAHWNGTEWALQRILYTYEGVEGIEELHAVYSFGENDFWVGGTEAYHWSGASWQQTGVTSNAFPGSIRKFYGTSSSDLYIVGTNGAIAHFNGLAWQKLASGTSLPINDIWGSRNGFTGALEILAAVGYPDFAGGDALLKISNVTVTAVSDSGINSLISAVWFEAGRDYYVAGDGVWSKTNPSDTASWSSYLRRNEFPDYIFALRGTGANDIFAAGGFGQVLHFDGYNWWTFVAPRLADGNYYSIAVQGNIIAAAGINNSSAVVTIGRR